MLAATSLVFKMAALAIVLVVCFAIGSNVSGLAEVSIPADVSSTAVFDVGAMLPSLVVMALWMTAVLTYVMLRSYWVGWKLVSAVFIALFGLNTFLPQIESLVFLQRQLPEGLVWQIILSGAIVAGLFSPVAVLVLGKLRGGQPSDSTTHRLTMPLVEWAWTLAMLAIAYVALYFLFGYFIAWQNPVLRDYYDGTTPTSFFAHLSGLWSATPWMFPFQAFRGLLYVTLALPTARMLKGGVPECALAVALLFSMGGGQLLLPNPYMPAAIRSIHLVETVSSNFIFGGLVGWLLSRCRQR